MGDLPNRFKLIESRLKQLKAGSEFSRLEDFVELHMGCTWWSLSKRGRENGYSLRGHEYSQLQKLINIKIMID